MRIIHLFLNKIKLINFDKEKNYKMGIGDWGLGLILNPHPHLILINRNKCF